jgi:hypothetical protein
LFYLACDHGFFRHIEYGQILGLDYGAGVHAICHGYSASAYQQLLFGSCEFFIAQHARVMQLGELLKLGGQIRRRSSRRRWCISILLGLRIGGALLIGFIIALLGSRILRRILLLLVVVDCTGGAGNDCRANRYACNTSSSHYSSGSHINLLINF